MGEEILLLSGTQEDDERTAGSRWFQMIVPALLTTTCVLHQFIQQSQNWQGRLLHGLHVGLNSSL